MNFNKLAIGSFFWNSPNDPTGRKIAPLGFNYVVISK